ncbi:hypothetical protein VMUT_1024 [Vulcanisaeta moutnovskia 768-28]|uniref:Uncharacterized protein n=1 Tax=Vulcanisaeta moutnovskia (strain 768-28) TaxID=985053 RepID=F0QXR8_VULM7|nr:hypothetical protein [Vulcanisaeta moutnovskia]ADY01231.1 hypothetical protein VMUT_1024 [Vulcanisaeta moutnovskia 768-28]
MGLSNWWYYTGTITKAMTIVGMAAIVILALVIAGAHYRPLQSIPRALGLVQTQTVYVPINHTVYVNQTIVVTKYINQTVPVYINRTVTVYVNKTVYVPIGNAPLGDVLGTGTCHLYSLIFSNGTIWTLGYWLPPNQLWSVVLRNNTIFEWEASSGTKAGEQLMTSVSFFIMVLGQSGLLGEIGIPMLTNVPNIPQANWIYMIYLGDWIGYGPVVSNSLWIINSSIIMGWRATSLGQPTIPLANETIEVILIPPPPPGQAVPSLKYLVSLYRFRRDSRTFEPVNSILEGCVFDTQLIKYTRPEGAAHQQAEHTFKGPLRLSIELTPSLLREFMEIVNAGANPAFNTSVDTMYEPPYALITGGNGVIAYCDMTVRIETEKDKPGSIILSSDDVGDIVRKVGYVGYITLSVPMPIPQVSISVKSLADAVNNLLLAKQALERLDYIQVIKVCRNVIYNDITEVKKQQRVIRGEVRELIMRRFGGDTGKFYEDILEKVEKMIRSAADYVSRFIHEELDQVLMNTSSADAEYAYRTTLTIVKYLADLVGVG